jgi:hypothetical protein
MSDGTVAGLVKAEQLASEMREMKQQAEERRWGWALGLNLPAG